MSSSEARKRAADRIEQSRQEFARRSRELLVGAARVTTVPETVYHFTDAQGLVGILTELNVRASLASASMDRSELSYATRVFEEDLRSGVISMKSLPTDWLLGATAAREATTDIPTENRSYIASFCAAAEGPHWLHYGRSGTGVAIAFATKNLASDASKHGFDLLEVFYDYDKQRRLVHTLVALADEFSAVCLEELKGQEAAARALCFDQLCGALGFLHAKNSAFTSEAEWRLSKVEMLLDGVYAEPPLETHFRVTGGRVVPYKTVPFQQGSVTGIRLGASCPMKTNERALAKLMMDTLGKCVPVTRSQVELRP